MVRGGTDKGRARRLAQAMLLALAAPSLGGCGLLQSIGLLPAPPAPVVAAPQPPPPPPTYALRVVLSASEDVNPDARGRPSPIRVQLYVGERDPRLDEAGFAAVFGAGPGSADGDGVALPTPFETLVLRPGERVDLALEPPRGHSRLAVAAAFREPWSALWSDAITLDTSVATVVGATLEAARVTLRAAPEPCPEEGRCR